MSFLAGIVAYFVTIFHNPQAQKDYEEGRKRAADAMERDPTAAMAEHLWRTAKRGAWSGVRGHYAKGMEDELSKRGYPDPYYSGW